ncbi:MAG: bifunctional phosphopantothenoylcysteine decarboxylase/phosphopantothenate--cysteine ligase CoaBC [Candidatus Latescibacterota bacterium]|nr:bifunctional phosphopantothenoylcysteine decarboxylase/phosphopantothenate--cysteine ligase CoaBC [Candidatus Latescibacterota bacterium]
MRLQGRRILLGVTGGIAAYKSPLVVRLLQEEGAQVRIVRTRSAAQFVTDTTLSVLSGRLVHADLFAPTDEFPVLHVGLARWAELFLVAPATANLIGKLAAGIADDLPTTIYLATSAPALLAPAMEEEMLGSTRVQASIDTLRAAGVAWVEPETGYLASGVSGKGRMAAPEVIVDAAVDRLAEAGGNVSGFDLTGRHVVVTAGPTVEDLDPVRFLTNRSSGKMGYAIAHRARARGATVHLVTGPTNLSPPAGVQVTAVRSAGDMHTATAMAFEEADAAILSAAVSDYRPRAVAAQKLKRSGDTLTIELVENPDIAAALGAGKGNRVVVAFAMETEDGPARARDKLKRKNADLIVLNILTEPGAGFGTDTNVVTLIDDSDTETQLPMMSKLDVADRILDEVRDRLSRRPAS